MRRLSVHVLGAAVWCVFCSYVVHAAGPRPNVLWLVGENLAHDLGCYGARHVHTPNLDRLAAQGVRYTRAFATNPACAPSRSAFFTGMYQTTTDTHHMRSHRDDGFRLPPGVRPITHRLRDAGYFTANVKTAAGQSVGTGKLDLNFVNEGPIYHDASSDWSELKRRQPFFAVVNAEESEYDIYDRKSAAKERVEWVGEREHVQHAKPDDVTPPPYYPDHPVVREEWARYLNSVSGMDARFGKVLDQLRAGGLEDDTIVIFFGDNGRLEPRGIHWCYDSGLRVPLIVKWPKNFPAPPQIKPGTVDDRIISLIDVTATTLDVTGIERPSTMQGRVFLGDRPDPPRSFAFAARDRIDETQQRIRSVHDERYHYIRTISTGPTFASLNRYKEKCFPILPLMRELQKKGELHGPPLDLMQRTGPCEELYDTAGDPHEIRNLLASTQPEHREALLRLRAALDVWMVETGDRGAIPEPASVVAPFEAEMHQWFGTPSWVRTAESPFVGRWALTIPDGRAGWLGVEQTNGAFAANLLWGGGSVLPAEDVSITGDTLTFRRATNAKNGLARQVITARCQGDSLTLSLHERRIDGRETEPQAFLGKRIAPLPPCPDLATVQFGEPVALIGDEGLSGWQLANSEAPNGWSVKDGVLSNRVDPQFGKRYGNLRTKRLFHDFRLTTEVRTLPGSNSGIYLRGVYEIQIADSHGKPSDTHSMGALYGRIAPSAPAEKPVGEWQTLEVTLVDRHVTVVLNGKTVIDNQPALGCTGGALTSDESPPGPLLIQGDHSDIDFRRMTAESATRSSSVLRKVSKSTTD